jgi:hypothetical protein
MNKSLTDHWAVIAALNHKESRNELYRQWNNRHDELSLDERKDDPELDRIQSRIDCLERDAEAVIHDLLFALDIYDKPMAR